MLRSIFISIVLVSGVVSFAQNCTTAPCVDFGSQVKATPSQIINGIGYTPVNKAGDTMTGALYAPSVDSSVLNGKEWNVKAFGAKGDGVTDDTAAINATLSACEAGGGGTIVFPLTSSGYVIKQNATGKNDIPSMLFKRSTGIINCNWDGGGNRIILRGNAAFGGTYPYPPNAYPDSPFVQHPIVAQFSEGSTTFTLDSTVGISVGDTIWWGYGVIPNQTPLGLEPYWYGFATVTAINGNQITIDQPAPAAENTPFVVGGLYKVTMTSTGTGYTSATCTVSDPTGTGATLIAAINNGQVTCYITAVGSGYTNPTLAVSGDGSGASGTITIANGYLVAGQNGSIWIVSQNATITDLQGYVYQNASIRNFNLITDIAGGGDAEEGFICTFCRNVTFQNITCSGAAGAGCVYPHYSDTVTAISTTVFSSIEQDGNRAKGRCIGLSKAHNTTFIGTSCNNFDTGAIVSEDPNDNVAFSNIVINDTSPNHCHGVGCPNQYIAAAGRITINNLTIEGNGNVPLFSDLTGTNVPEIRNVTLRTINPVIIYDPILERMTGFLNIVGDSGGNDGSYREQRRKYGSCTVRAGTTGTCQLPSGILTRIELLPDSAIAGVTSLRIWTGYGTGSAVVGPNLISGLAPGTIYVVGHLSTPVSYDTSWFAGQPNYKNQTNRVIQINNNNNSSDTTLVYMAQYIPAVNSDSSDMVAQDVNLAPIALFLDQITSPRTNINWSLGSNYILLSSGATAISGNGLLKIGDSAANTSGAPLFQVQSSGASSAPFQFNALSNSQFYMRPSGNLVLRPQTNATSSANISGFGLESHAAYFDGSISSDDNYTCKDIPGAGSNPRTVFACAHSGSPGQATYSFDAPIQIGTIGTRPNCVASPAAANDVGEGAIWYTQGTGTSHGHLDVCQNESGVYQWVSDTNYVYTASLTTTAASSDTVSISGVTTSSHCSLTATSATAASNLTSVYISAKASNSVTVTHPAVAGMTFDLMCTAN